MKRRLSIGYRSSPSAKMMKIESSSEDRGSGRNFEFKLTDQKVKANLRKSAVINHFVKEMKQRSINLRFSAGAYLKVAKEVIKECQNKFIKGESINQKNFEICVQDFRDGLELSGKHFDTKIVFNVNNQKVVMHCYNSTQNLKIEGGNYVDFVENFLEPLLLSNIEKTKSEISNLDRSIIANLDVKKAPFKPSSLKKIRSQIYFKGSKCTTCDKTFESNSKLRMHKMIDHSNNKSFSLSLESIKHSTRNNSISEELMLCEDLTVSENNYDVNYQKCFERVHAISRKWARYQLSLKGRVTIAKTFMLPQFTYIASVLDPSAFTYDEIG